MPEINWLAQLVTAAIPLLIGAIWYGPLFGKVWLKESGLTEEKIKSGYHPGILYGLTYVLAFIITIGLKLWVIDIHAAFNSVTEYPFWHGAQHGFTMAFYFGAIPVLIINALFNQRSWKFILVGVGYWLLSLSLMAGIIELLA